MSADLFFFNDAVEHSFFTVWGGGGCRKKEYTFVNYGCRWVGRRTHTCNYLESKVTASEGHADGRAEEEGALLRLATHHTPLGLLDVHHSTSGGCRVVEVPAVVKVELARVEDEQLSHGLFVHFNLLTTKQFSDDFEPCLSYSFNSSCLQHKGFIW